MCECGDIKKDNMLKKLISMATAALVLAGGLSVVAAPMASASGSTTTYNIDCNDTSSLLSADGWETASLGQRFVATSGKQKSINLNPSDVVVIVASNCNLGSAIAATPVNASVANSVTLQATNGSVTTSGWDDSFAISLETLTVTAGSTLGKMSPTGMNRNYVKFTKNSTNIVFVFTESSAFSDATASNLMLRNSQMMSISYSPTFSSSQYTYSATTSSQTVTLSASTTEFLSTVSVSCNGTLLQNPGSSCSLNDGSNTVVATVTAADGTTTLNYTITVTYAAPSAPVIASTSTIANGQSGAVITVTTTGQVIADPSKYTISVGTTGLTRTTINTQVSGTAVFTFTGTAQPGTLTIQFKSNAWPQPEISASNTLSFVVPGGSQQNNSSSSSPSSTAAATAAAKAAAAVVVAKTALVETLKAGKPITAADLNAADLNIASSKAAERVAAKVLALPEVLRTDLAKVEAIVKTENFVEKVSTPATQISVTTRDLVIHELLTSDYKYKTSVVKAILAKDVADLDSIEKIQAVVKAQLAAIDARKARIAAVQARVLTYSQK